MNDEFISEPIEPEPGTADLSAMSRGEPGLPRRFGWRQESIEVASVVQKWKSSTRDRGESYLRRHWFEILSTDGRRLTLYCERQARVAKKPNSRWWLYKISPSYA